MAKLKSTGNGKKTTQVKSVKSKSIVDEKEFQLTPEMSKTLRTSIVVLLIFFAFYIIATIKSDYVAPKKNNQNKEADIQYTEILAGTSFNRTEPEYIVVYYDKSDSEDDETSELDEAVSRHHSPDSFYTCDLSIAFNKPYVTSEEANTNPENAEQLAINGPTIIKFTDGHVSEYIQGKDEVISYLNEH